MVFYIPERSKWDVGRIGRNARHPGKYETVGNPSLSLLFAICCHLSRIFCRLLGNSTEPTEAGDNLSHLDFLQVTQSYLR